MAKTGSSLKHLAIDKSNAQMIGTIAAASFVTIFCLVASHAVWSQNNYQSRVTAADQKAKNQLVENISNYGSLSSSYNSFNSGLSNVIGGQTSGTGQNQGSNSTIILDALPDTYDFPALTSSIEKILTNQGLTISAITGTDEQITEQTNVTSPNPQPVSMPFSFTVTDASYSSIQQLVTTLQASVRPIQIDSLTLSGSIDDMTLVVNAHTYYQPAKSLGITTQAIQ